MASATEQPANPRVIRTVPALRRALAPILAAEERLALVPTMGALHDGHLSLVRIARRRADWVVVSIFVNPTQFAPGEDFATYPRNLPNDLAMLAKEGIDLVWAPTPETMFPPDFATRINPEGPASVGLEDKFRPHFFVGVATVVAKLLIQCQPSIAIFGEKDYQQLRVVTQLANDLDLPVRIIGASTRRDPDGLAMSSRNAYLSAEERAAAPTLYRVLRRCSEAIGAGESTPALLNEGRRDIERAGFALDYLEARHAETLAPIGSLDDGPMRLLVAARIGRTRLIDNIAVPPDAELAMGKSHQRTEQRPT
jgi:pantoate--beta-alanine ligase